MFTSLSLLPHPITSRNYTLHFTSLPPYTMSHTTLNPNLPLKLPKHQICQRIPPLKTHVLPLTTNSSINIIIIIIRCFFFFNNILSLSCPNPIKMGFNYVQSPRWVQFGPGHFKFKAAVQGPITFPTDVCLYINIGGSFSDIS